jgi:phage tail tape-measure protein
MQTLGKGTNILKAAKGGVFGLATGLALDYGSDLAKEKGMNKTAAGLNVAGEAATWAGTGALVGSFVPILGTAVGAAVGGIAGGIYGLAQNWDTLFKEEKAEKAEKDKMVDPMVNSDQEIINTLKAMAANADQSRKLQERSVRHLDDISSNVDTSGPPSFYG